MVHISFSNNDLLAGRDASFAFEASHHSVEAREMLNQYYVGQYIDVSILFV